jgi:hypothetical protein
MVDYALMNQCLNEGIGAMPRSASAPVNSPMGRASGTAATEGPGSMWAVSRA